MKDHTVSRTLIVFLHVVALLICGGETLYLSSWHKVPVQVTAAEIDQCPADDDLDGVAICSRVRYTYQVDGVSYESPYLRPFFNNENDEIFWRAFNAKRSGKSIDGFVSPRFPQQSALERFPGQISTLVLWLLIGAHLVYWPARSLLRRFAAYLAELEAKKEGRFDGPARRGRPLRLAVFLLGSLLLMVSPVLEKALLPWKQEAVQVLSMASTPGPKEYCMTVVMHRVEARPGTVSERVMDVCNAGALFQLTMHMQTREPMTLYVRDNSGKEIVKLGPRVTSDRFRWALWYALVLVV